MRLALVCVTRVSVQRGLTVELPHFPGVYAPACRREQVPFRYLGEDLILAMTDGTGT
jgi:hypothetical protein